MDDEDPLLPEVPGTGASRGLPATRPRLHPPAAYAVGYARPPEASRFPKGRSGNPAGRPKGAKAKASPALSDERLKTILLAEAYRPITVRDGARAITIPMAQAVVRAMAVNAAKGQHRAQRLFTELLSTTERQNRALHDAWMDTAIGYKTAWEKELDRRARLGISGPAPLPHPDHVVIDIRRGTAHIAGPATRAEQAEHDHWLGQKALLRKNLATLRRALKRETDADERADIEAHLGVGEATLARMDKLIPG